MITETLISDAAWAEAPEDPEEAFLFIALAAHEQLSALRRDDADLGQFDFAFWRQQYIQELCSIASGLGISGLPDPNSAVLNSGNMAAFDAALARVLTTIKVKHRDKLRADSVALSFQTKEDIRKDLEELRDKVNKSNLSDKAKAALHKKIDAVEAELNRDRSSMRPFWLLAGAIAIATPQVVGTLSDLPGAVETVNKVVEAVHVEKAAEAAAELRRTMPQLLAKEQRLQITDQSDKAE